MLPFLNMRLYRGNNLNLSKHIEKLKNNQLTIENVLEEDDIIQDLKLNTNSQFIQILSNEAIRKLMDYATKMPASDDQKTGHKFPFNATEILCADNSAIQERIMNEITYKESIFYEQLNENKEEDQKEKKEEKDGEEDKKEEKNVDEKKEEKIEEKVEAGEKKQESGFVSGLNAALNKVKEEQKNEEKEKEKKENTEKPSENKPNETNKEKKEEVEREEINQEEKKEEPKKEESPKSEEKKEESPKSEEKKEESPKKEEKKEEPPKIEEKKEEPTKPEEKKQETPKTEEKKEEPAKPEEKKEEPAKPEEKKEETPKIEEKKEETPKIEEKKEETPKTEEKKEEPKKEELPKTEDTSKKEEAKKEDVKTELPTPGDAKKEEKKPEEVEEKKEEEKKEEPKNEEKKPEENEAVNPEETKPNEKKQEKPEDEQEKGEEPKKEENEEENEEEEKGQHKHSLKDDEEDNQNNNEENEDSENENEEDVKTVIIYDNIDYLFLFLQQNKETVSNHVLVGYFYKILNHLISSQAIKIVNYIFDYPYKSKFDVLDAIVTNLNRKSMGSIVNKLLLFTDESTDLTDKKKILAKKMLEELEKTDEKEKYECICDVLASTLNNKSFYLSFMSDSDLVDLLFCLLEKSVENQKKLICVINLLIKVNDNVLKNLSNHCTKSLLQENPLDFMSLFNYDTSYPLDEKQIDTGEMDEINKKVLLSLFNTLKKTEFKFFEDLGTYNQDNEEFLTTYQQKQKKIGMKKLAQTEFLRTILDVFVNANYSQIHEKEIEELIQILNKKNIFYYCHKLFFDFPFSNIYQTYYNQIIDIVTNQSSPSCLIESFFKYSDGKEERNLVTDLMNHFNNNMKFKFNSENISFNPCSSFEITLLNKFNNTENENIKKLFTENNDLKVFDKVLGEEINRIYNQKLLLSDTLGANFGSEDEKPLQTFGKASFMEIIEEDIEIYNIYKNGGDYETKFNEKIEREKAEREKAEQEIVGEEEENKDEHINPDDEEENEEGVEELGAEKDGEEGEEANKTGEEGEQKEDQDKEKENENEKEKGDEKIDTSDEQKSESTDEEGEKKEFNDVNFWKPEIKPTDDIMSSIISDLE